MNVCDDRWEFEDRAPVFSESKAADLCLCYTDLCEDGTTARLCFPSPKSVEFGEFSSLQGDSAQFPDGSVTTFGQGYARCYGLGDCSFVNEPCRDGLWFVECLSPTPNRFMYDGREIRTRDDAISACGGFP